MAGSATVEKPTTVYDLENEDIFERFNLKKVQFLNRGMSGEVFLVTSKTKPGKKLAVKTFDLSSDEVRDRSLRQFSTEAGVMQQDSNPGPLDPKAERLPLDHDATLPLDHV
ncbi:hypothetical protein ElyMa_006403000 [Elysia marginata]|uniref:Protein kinase domain-containing protein n=1 Tax=Elysia marginata TaxID=1093978 RepID=A0AAV4HS99_9GAST|nr:hypothetical protein ElyMa_006403000 [Elysia marginata]